MAQNFLKLTGNVHLGTICPKKNGQVDWGIMGISVSKMQTQCRQGHKMVDTSLDDDYRQYLPISDVKNTYILAIIDAVNNDGEFGNTAEIVNRGVYESKRDEMEVVRLARKVVLDS